MVPDDVTPEPADEKPAKKKVAKKASAKGAKKKAAKKSTKKTAKKVAKNGDEKQRAKRIERPFPRVMLQEAIKVPLAIKDKNGGNPWTPDQVAKAVSFGPRASGFFYLTAAARDFGLTEGTRDSDEISLTDLGRRLVYAENPDQEAELRRQAFLKIDLFRQVLDYYKGNILPEMNYLRNTLENKFKLDPAIHEEFADLFRKNCEYLGIKEGVPLDEATKKTKAGTKVSDAAASIGPDFVTVAEPEDDTGLVCFVAMPFSERHEEHVEGFFTEVLNQIIAPAGRKAGFKVVTAKKQGSDVIQSTIVNGLLDADLVVVDLTEHNPNVLFELGMRLAQSKPCALIRAKGTPPIFDVDHILRVEDYNPSLWRSTVEIDMPKISDHIKSTWENRETSPTYMQILRTKATAK